MLLNVVLPMRVFDTKAMIELVIWIQEKNHRSYLSHSKKKFRKCYTIISDVVGGMTVADDNLHFRVGAALSKLAPDIVDQVSESCLFLMPMLKELD